MDKAVRLRVSPMVIQKQFVKPYRNRDVKNI